MNQTSAVPGPPRLRVGVVGTGRVGAVLGAALARAGHHAKVLIADGNYPASTAIGPNAKLVSLNLAPGIVTVSQVLETLLTAIPVDAINTMGIPADDPYALSGDPPVWADYRRIVAASGSTLVRIQANKNFEFCCT